VAQRAQILIFTRERVRSVCEKDGVFYVSFPSHPAYFEVRGDAMQERLRAAENEGRRVSIIYDLQCRVRAAR